MFRFREDFYFFLKSASKGNESSKEELRRLMDRVKEEKDYRKIQEVFDPLCSQQNPKPKHIYLQGKSFKEMLFYRSMIVKNKTNVQFSYFGKNFHSVRSNNDRIIKNKLSNIVVISSHSGKNLSNLINFYKEAARLPSSVKKLICIEGSYTASEWEEKINNIISLSPNTLYIYQGHSQVSKGKIQWQGIDKPFPAPEKITNYLHLACTTIEANEDLLSLPGKKNFLPVAFLPDIDLREEVNAMFTLMGENKNFLSSAEQAFANIQINNLPAFVSVRCA